MHGLTYDPTRDAGCVLCRRGPPPSRVGPLLALLGLVALGALAVTFVGVGAVRHARHVRDQRLALTTSATADGDAGGAGIGTGGAGDDPGGPGSSGGTGDPVAPAPTGPAVSIHDYLALSHALADDSVVATLEQPLTNLAPGATDLAARRAGVTQLRARLQATCDRVAAASPPDAAVVLWKLDRERCQVSQEIFRNEESQFARVDALAQAAPADRPEGEKRLRSAADTGRILRQHALDVGDEIQAEEARIRQAHPGEL